MSEGKRKIPSGKIKIPVGKIKMSVVICQIT